MPWQRVNDTYPDCNAAAQVGVKGSVFEYWANVLRFRKTHKDIFIYGDYQLIDPENNDVFAYTRTFEDQTAVVAANFRANNVEWSLPNITLQKEKVLISNYGDLVVKDGVVSLRPFEAFACPLAW